MDKECGTTVLRRDTTLFVEHALGAQL